MSQTDDANNVSLIVNDALVQVNVLEAFKSNYGMTLSGVARGQV